MNRRNEVINRLIKRVNKGIIKLNLRAYYSNKKIIRGDEVNCREIR